MGDAPGFVAIADLDGDGKPDLAVANAISDNISILLGTGTGSFGPATNFAVGLAVVMDFPFSLAIGDLNGDGKPDLAVANSNSDNVSILLNATPFAPAGAFGSPTNFAVGTGPLGVAIGDVNRDGKADLVVTNGGDDNVSVFLGTGTGSFGPATNFSVAPGGSTPNSVVIADFNRDGKPDLATANQNSDNVTVRLGTGTGTFGPATTFTVGNFPASVATGDFNQDGIPDLAVPNADDDNVSILLGTGTGSFGTATNFGVGDFPVALAVGDLNEDGKLDLAVANRDTDNVSVLLGNGDGTFVAAVNFAVGNGPASVAIGDFNRDGKLDLVVGNFFGQSVSILLGTGTGSFGAATNFAVTDPIALAIRDLNRDGKLDLAVATHGGNNVSILMGTGTGAFGPATAFPVGTLPDSLAIGDLNGDGRPDIAAANFFSNNVSVLLNEGPANQLSALITLVNSFNLQPAGIANSLTAKLRNAIAAANAGDVATACGLLDAFINEVQAQTGKKLTVPQATQLINDANRIKSVLGCP